jgi:argininosuccinate lyase
MENTGRIRKLLSPTARRILFGQSARELAEEQLQQIARVDQAHLLMLAECGILEWERVARLLAAIERLVDAHFEPLRGREASRGIFLLYEEILMESEGAALGGMIQTARSRNDLNATVLKLQLRDPYAKLVRECTRLHAILLAQAKRYGATIMPIYTHGQAAMPGTYGHYLAGITSALSRDLEGILSAAADLQVCPLGAGAVAGTSLLIRPERTAELLGFARGPIHSLDAVASRDLVLRLLSACTIYAITLSRFATDLSQWTTAEFSFLSLPDELVGSSSAMPQKRNPFLLEHIQGRAGALLGAFVSAASSMHGTPFTNAIAVGTEAVKPVWGALQTLTETVVLMRLLAAGARPNHDTMRDRAMSGFTTATEFVNRLVTDGNLDFRTAHRLIGAAVLASIETGGSFEEIATACLKEHGVKVSAAALDPEQVVRSMESGGGPGEASLNHCLESLRRTWRDHCQQLQMQRRGWQKSEARLKTEVKMRMAEFTSYRAANALS